MSLEIGRLTRLQLGRVGENKARRIEIDVSEWLADWPGATVGLLLMRPGEDGFYPVAAQVEDNVLKYTILRSDVEIEGEGLAQIVLVGDDDVELRSRVVTTKVEESLPGSETAAPVNPMQPFVGQVLDAADRAEKAAKDAEEAAGSAFGYGEANAGKLLYIGTDGKAIPLALGDGLKVVNGVLHVIGGGSAAVMLTVDANGNATLRGATLTVDANGNAEIVGGDVVGDASGDATIS